MYNCALSVQQKKEYETLPQYILNVRRRQEGVRIGYNQMTYEFGLPVDKFDDPAAMDALVSKKRRIVI